LRPPRRSSAAGDDDKGVSAEPDHTDAPRRLLELYDDALPAAYGYFVRRCADRATAEDLTSETFLAAMDAARRPQPPPIVVPWLLGVTRHKLADHYRRRQTRETLTVAEVPECAQLLGRTVHATEALLVRARRAFRSQYPEGGVR
jgi:RNA polymerase sigma-70 factor (ECF subfamily)